MRSPRGARRATRDAAKGGDPKQTQNGETAKRQTTASTADYAGSADKDNGIRNLELSLSTMLKALSQSKGNSGRCEKIKISWDRHSCLSPLL